MANAPISIGELDNVPAPLSPIQSPWAQDVTKRIVHRFVSVAERAARYPDPLLGALSIAQDRGYLEMFGGADWGPIGEAPSLVPAYSAPAGGGAGGALTPNQTGRMVRYTGLGPSSLRVFHSVLLASSGPWSGRLFVSTVAPQATIFNTFVMCPGPPYQTTGHLVGVMVPGIDAGTLVDVSFENAATSTGHVSWFLDGTNNYGYAKPDAR